MNPAKQTLLACAAIAFAISISTTAWAQRFADFGQAELGQQSVRTRSSAIGDLNGDEHPDIVIATIDASAKPSLALYYGNGNGHFRAATAAQFPTPAPVFQYSRVFLEDLDRDGDLDIFAAGPKFFTFRSTTLLINDGKGVFRDVTATALPPSSTESNTGIALLDVDGDGDLDIFHSGILNKRMPPTVWDNDGRGRFSNIASRIAFMPGISVDLEATDIDGDGDTDLLSLASGARLWLHGPRGTWTEAPASDYPRALQTPLATIDIDRDGDLDLITPGYAGSAGPIAGGLWRNNGKGVFKKDTTLTLPRPSRLWRAQAVDIDADGWSDLLLQELDGTSAFWMNKNGRLLASESTVFSKLFHGAAFGDIDRDGDVDAVAGANNQKTKLLTNLSRQIQTPAEAMIGTTTVLGIFAHPGRLSMQVSAFPWLAAKRLSRNIDVPGLGSLGIDPAGAIPLAPVIVRAPTGFAPIPLRIPRNTALRGVPLHFQCVFSPPAKLSNPTRVTLR